MTARMDCAQLRRALAWFLAGAAPMVPLKAVAFRARERNREGEASEKFDATKSAPALMAIGATAGLASGLLGIGGGTLVTPLLALASPLPQAAVLGTSLLAMLPPSVVALGDALQDGKRGPAHGRRARGRHGAGRRVRERVRGRRPAGGARGGVLLRDAVPVATGLFDRSGSSAKETSRWSRGLATSRCIATV